jgi:hypothetical protein
MRAVPQEVPGPLGMRFTLPLRPAPFTLALERMLARFE